MKYLVTGGCGFVGANLSAEVLKRGEKLFIFDNFFRIGSNENLKWLKTKGNFEFIYGDIRNNNDIENVIKTVKPDVIFHLSGQVAMTTSIENPRLDFEVNVIGTINLLESLRKYHPDGIVIYSSTNKVYGDLEWVRYEETETRYTTPGFPNGFPETIPLNFRTPYGCSKGAADQYVLDYSRIFGIKTIVFRHSSIYGSRQFATYDQGWITWFCIKAIETKKGILKEPFTISGSGKQVRDVLYIDDLVNLYFLALKNIKKAQGQVYNIGGGLQNSLSIIELLLLLEKELNIKLNYRKIDIRKSDQLFFVADITKAYLDIGWEPIISKEVGINETIKWLNNII